MSHHDHQRLKGKCQVKKETKRDSWRSCTTFQSTEGSKFLYPTLWREWLITIYTGITTTIIKRKDMAALTCHQMCRNVICCLTLQCSHVSTTAKAAKTCQVCQHVWSWSSYMSVRVTFAIDTTYLKKCKHLSSNYWTSSQFTTQQGAAAS